MSLALVALLVPDYDEAIDYFTKTLGFTLQADEPRPEGKRWVVVTPGSDGGTGLLLARAKGAQADGIGRQFAGRVGLFLHTTDFSATLAQLRGKGVKFVEDPRNEAYGKVVVFEDLYGNRWDLIEPAPRGRA